uniref:NADH-ubiquinone oxidoreductase chain 3 n=1 Tax=Aenasius arizonensis TaxID=2058190 RepID=A0A6B9XL18_9HYME|nr:NADH dehydrogenase subunit 3 [Aenasius arizonensis]QHR84890.1 NADH dehydrogenase subunit 3 [Aenasius arizonensis]
MLGMFVIMIFSVLIILLMLLMNFLISKKLFKSREKMSPFECGFDPLSKSRLPFSMQFYLISIIFLIFDVEIALILPFIYFNSLSMFMVKMNMLVILLVLIFGLYLEWLDGALKWFK